VESKLLGTRAHMIRMVGAQEEKGQAKQMPVSISGLSAAPGTVYAATHHTSTSMSLQRNRQRLRQAAGTVHPYHAHCCTGHWIWAAVAWLSGLFWVSGCCPVWLVARLSRRTTCGGGGHHLFFFNHLLPFPRPCFRLIRLAARFTAGSRQSSSSSTCTSTAPSPHSPQTQPRQRQSRHRHRHTLPIYANEVTHVTRHTTTAIRSNQTASPKEKRRTKSCILLMRQPGRIYFVQVQAVVQGLSKSNYHLAD
jgi:hypothetical protein